MESKIINCIAYILSLNKKIECHTTFKNTTLYFNKNTIL